MRVKATQKGYYGHKRRNIGDVFDLVPYKVKDAKGKEVVVTAEKQFSEKWMVPAKKGVKAPEPESDLEEEESVTDDSQGQDDDDVI